MNDSQLIWEALQQETPEDQKFLHDNIQHGYMNISSRTSVDPSFITLLRVFIRNLFKYDFNSVRDAFIYNCEEWGFGNLPVVQAVKDTTNKATAVNAVLDNGFTISSHNGLKFINLKPIHDENNEESVFNDQLKQGIEVEKEHTPDSNIAKKIALDHLKEDPLYYTKLKKCGL